MFSITIEGDARLIKGLDRAIEKVGHARPMLINMGETVLREVGRQFDAEGARLEPYKWQALTQKTILDRIRRGFPPGPILTRTGLLRDSFQKEVTDEFVRVYNPVEYFKYHQEGTPFMAQRRMLAFPEWLKQDIIAQATSFISEAMRGM